MRHASGFISRGRENTALHQRYPTNLLDDPLTEKEYRPYHRRLIPAVV